MLPASFLRGLARAVHMDYPKRDSGLLPRVPAMKKATGPGARWQAVQGQSEWAAAAWRVSRRKSRRP